MEINSSFYRHHRPATYARWAASVPPGFRFAVKLPREITHRRRLGAATEPLDEFLDEVGALGGRLGPLLIQLPPSFAYNDVVAEAFLAALRTRFAGDAVCEPRHPTWFADTADDLLSRYRVARVAADPPPAPRAELPGGWPGIVYRRLHGSPRMYYSSYADLQLDDMARAMHATPGHSGKDWCIFDNTALGHATENAIGLLTRLQAAIGDG